MKTSIIVTLVELMLYAIASVIIVTNFGWWAFIGLMIWTWASHMQMSRYIFDKIKKYDWSDVK